MAADCGMVLDIEETGVENNQAYRALDRQDPGCGADVFADLGPLDRDHLGSAKHGRGPHARARADNGPGRAGVIRRRLRRLIELYEYNVY